MVKLLAKWNVTATVANNGMEAVKRLKEQTFDVILMDLHMPVMDGYQATQLIRGLKDQAKAQTPIIALTASVSHNIYDKIHEAGMTDYLSKPFQAASLYKKLELLSASKMSKALAG